MKAAWLTRGSRLDLAAFERCLQIRMCWRREARGKVEMFVVASCL